MIRSILKTALLTTALVGVSVGGALAKDTIVWWDFLGGGDGVRMKALMFTGEKPDLRGLSDDVPLFRQLQRAPESAQVMVNCGSPNSLAPVLHEVLNDCRVDSVQPAIV